MPRLEAVFFSWLVLASASHGLASVSTLLPRLCLIVFASVWKVVLCLGSVVISHLRERPPTELKFKFKPRETPYRGMT